MRKIILFASILLMGLSVGVSAQERDQDCNIIGNPAGCGQLAAGIQSIEDQTSNLQRRLRGASPGLKAVLLRSINRLNSRRADLVEELRRCRREHGPTPRELAPSELDARLIGTATMRTSDGNAAGPFSININIGLRFSRDRCAVTITDFPKISFTTRDLPVLGRINVDVTKARGGSGIFHPVSGTLSVGITLHFHYDTFALGDDDARFALTTGSSVSTDRRFNVSGSPLTAAGNIILVGTTTFQNGYLEGESGSLIITANISPVP